MIDRRTVLLSAASLAGCDVRVGATPAALPVLPLKDIAPFPVGVCAAEHQLDDADWSRLALRHFSQITPEWQMKMEYILQPDFSRRYAAPDRLAAFAKTRGLRLHGHALIWYSQGEDLFAGLPKDRFVSEFDRYIADVVSHYRGEAVSWDVVNEAITDEGSDLRQCHWSAAFGTDGYIARAFHNARDADPDATLFLNDYNLESNATKGATYLRLVERLLAAEVPISGLGIQSHLDIRIPSGAISNFMRDAAQFGLPIHVSEVDASLRSGEKFDFRSMDERTRQQTARVSELATAFMDLPPSQRFAFSVWGLRDIDSPFRRDEKDDGKDRPVLFGADGRPNPAYYAIADAFKGSQAAPPLSKT